MPQARINSAVPYLYALIDISGRGKSLTYFSAFEQVTHYSDRSPIIQKLILYPLDCASRLIRLFHIEENRVQHRHDNHRQDASERETEHNGHRHCREEWIRNQR